MEIIKVDIDKLTPDPQNAKEHPAWQIEQIKASIETFGNLDPIGVWGDDNLIVEGHGRYIALKELGYNEAEVIRLDWFGFLSSEDGADARHRVHPTQKPVSLLTDILKQWGEKADLVVDLYGGSGSTLIACDQLKKTCYICELEPHYCDVILKRWEDLTDGKAVLLNGES